MTGFAPRSTFRRATYRPRLISDWAKDFIAFVLTMLFVAICVGPVLDWILALFGVSL